MLEVLINSYGFAFRYVQWEFSAANSFVSQDGAISVWPSDQDYIFTMGNRIVSFYDIKLVNTHYACTCASGATCVNGIHASLLAHRNIEYFRRREKPEELCSMLVPLGLWSVVSRYGFMRSYYLQVEPRATRDQLDADRLSQPPLLGKQPSSKSALTRRPSETTSLSATPGSLLHLARLSNSTSLETSTPSANTDAHSMVHNA